VENDNKTNDNEDNEVVTHRTHMEVDSMVVITTKKLDDSTAQSGDYNDELVTISVHIAKNMRVDGLGYECTRTNEGGNNTYTPLICEKDVNCFHVNV
jgi:hypothetical protein